ncbi:SufE family protein [bacterium BMS3Abin03]|jgi:cysteine desulfuration protein SufE|nr:SufE family protein [bacterium BMS3Abin03]MCG6960691.1 SufE family protein [bacterium BMS3Abin03]
MTINESQDQIIEELLPLNDWFEKYEYLISLGKALKPLDEEFKTEDNLIKGCQSKVWLRAEKKDNKIYLAADSDTLITKGIIALLLRVLNNQSPEDIINCNLYFVEKIGLSTNLSPARANGVVSIIKQIVYYANELK